MNDLEKKTQLIFGEFTKFVNNANEAYENNNISNLAINARSCIEQLCNLAFAQYEFTKETTLKDKISFLESNNIIKSSEAELMQKIRETGNAIVHGDSNIKYDIKELYLDFSDSYDLIADEICDFLEKENKPQSLANSTGGNKIMKEYKFSDIVFGFEPSSKITINGDILNIASKHGGTINMNEITNISFLPATTLKKGNLFFSFPGGAIGVYWSTVLENKKMNANAQEIYNIVIQYINRNKNRSSGQTINNIINEKSPAEQVKELKELLDMGIINQEEFEKKKKELLGL